ncbi:MAG: response regulator [Calditrichaeota bacterium]|nr:response regulator [Calditrichota bacterium]
MSVLANQSSIYSSQLILIVEDDPVSCRFIKDALSDSYQLIVANNGLSGLQKARREIPDLIITDIKMPKLNGFEMIEQLKSLPETNHIPIIIISSKDSDEDFYHGLEEGAIDYLFKPFDRDLLLNKIRNILDLFDKFRDKINLQSNNQLNDLPDDISHFDEEFIEQIKHFIIDNITNDTIDAFEIADHFGFSESSLYRKLRKITGKGVNSYIQSVKLDRAYHLIEQTYYSIYEVAAKCGFHSESYFIKTFKKKYGFTPAKLRKLIS